MKQLLISLILGLVVMTACPMEPNGPRGKKHVPLSLISADNRRFWIAAEKVAQFSKLQKIYEQLDDSKLLKTDLNEASLHLLKDLIDAKDEKQDLKRVIALHKNIPLERYAALLAQAKSFELPAIAQEVAGQIYDTQSEFTPTAFRHLKKKIDLAYGKLVAIHTCDTVFILPEAIASTCPYLSTMLSSSLKESRARILKVPADQSTDTIRFIKNIVEFMHPKVVAQGANFDFNESIKPELIEMAYRHQSLSVDDINVADQWLMPEVARVLAQVLLQKKPESIAGMAPHLYHYIPHFTVEDAPRLQECALFYLEYIATMHENKFFEKSQKILAKKLIESIAENIDDYINDPYCPLALFQQPKMRAMTVLLNSQLIQKKKITEAAPVIFQPYSKPNVNPFGHRSLIKLEDKKFVVWAQDENPQIYSNSGKHLCTLKGDFFERVKSVSADKGRCLVTASYYESMFGDDPHLYLKVWSDDGTLVKTKTVAAPGKPEVTLQALDSNMTLVTLGHERMLWDGYRNTLRKADIAISDRVVPVDRGIVGICTQDDPNNYSFGTLNLANNTRTIWKRAAGVCQHFFKLDDNHILVSSTPPGGYIFQREFEIWNSSTGTCHATIDKNDIKGAFIVAKIGDHLLVIDELCLLVYNHENNLVVRSLSDRTLYEYKPYYKLARELTSHALALDNTHVAMASVTPKGHSVIIRECSDLLPIEEIVRKRIEQSQQSYCPVM